MSSYRGRGVGAVQPPSSTNPRGVNAMGPRNTQKQKGTAVITLDELDRIRRQVIETKEDSYETLRNNQRATLQQTSKARVGNWSNTMEAMRYKREEDRIKKLEDAEVSGQTFSKRPIHGSCKYEDGICIIDNGYETLKGY